MGETANCNKTYNFSRNEWGNVRDHLEENNYIFPKDSMEKPMFYIECGASRIIFKEGAVKMRIKKDSKLCGTLDEYFCSSQ